MDEAGHQPLEQLPLAEHDHGLVAHARGDVVEALHRLAEPDERDQQPGAAGEESAGHGERSGEAERSQRDVYEDCTFLSSAVIAGTTSARSPITA